MPDQPEDRFLTYSQKYQSVEKAEKYDQRHFPTLKGRVFIAAERRTLARAFRSIKPKGNVLDMPCGTGRITQQLLEHGFHVTGADISDQMMAVAKAKLSHYPKLVGFAKADAKNLDFPNETFDAAVSMRFLGNIPHAFQRQAIKELARVSRDIV